MKDIIHSQKAALVSGAGTTGVGLATILEILPSIMGIFATLGGIILSTVLIYKYILEIRILKDKRKETRDRLEKGLVCRRCTDIIDGKDIPKENGETASA